MYLQNKRIKNARFGYRSKFLGVQKPKRERPANPSRLASMQPAMMPVLGQQMDFYDPFERRHAAPFINAVAGAETTIGEFKDRLELIYPDLAHDVIDYARLRFSASSTDHAHLLLSVN